MLGLEAMVATSGCTKLQNLKKKIDIIFYVYLLLL